MGQGPDVLLHGLTGNLASWHLGVVPLLQEHYRLLTYDLRGHGYSDCPSSAYTIADMAQDLQELLDALAIPQAALVGHSYGADAALSFALLHAQRVTQLVAAEPALPAIIQLHRDRTWAAWEMLSQALAELGLVVPRRTLPHVREVLLPASAWGHLGPLEHPDHFAAAAHEFIQPSRVSAAAG